MKLRFTNSGEETEKPIYVCGLDEYEHNKETTNFLIRDKLTKREATINIDKRSIKPYMLEQSGSFSPICTFDCRGVEPIEFYPGAGFKADHPTTGHTFEPELSEDYADYDEDAKEPVGIYSVESKFEKSKEK